MEGEERNECLNEKRRGEKRRKRREKNKKKESKIRQTKTRAKVSPTDCEGEGVREQC